MDLWNTDTPIRDFDGVDLTIPSWLDRDITPADVAAICQGGCASGAYMPAVTYHTANKIMADHGDEVLQYIEDCADELPPPKKGESWSGMAVHYLSYAVELWAQDAEQHLAEFEPESV